MGRREALPACAVILAAVAALLTLSSSPGSAAPVTVSPGQLLINQRISQAAILRADALREKLDGSITGADIRPEQIASTELHPSVVASGGESPGFALELDNTLAIRPLPQGGGGVAPPARMTELAPLMSALLAMLVEHGQQLAFCAPEHRLAMPFAFVLDEVPAIAPFPELPAHMATGGGYGMPTLAVAQDLAQLAERWGPERAQTMWDNAVCRLVMPGALDERTEEAARRAGGEVLEMRRSGGASVGRSGRAGWGTTAQSSQQESWREDWGPAIRRGEIARLPLGAALCLASGLRPLRVTLVGQR